MTFETKRLRGLSVLLLSGLALGACGEGDDDGDDEVTGGGTSSGGSSTGGRVANTGGRSTSAGAASEESAGASSEGGSGGEIPAASGGEDSTSSGGTDASGGTDSATGGQSSPPSTECETPSEPAEHCYADNDDRPGTAVCSEYYTQGLAMLFCTAPEAGGCPQNDELAAACIGGLTSAYYYTDAANEGFWDEGAGGCEVNGGAWCRF